MSFKCCIICVPPKRHIGCHADCEEYLEEKAKHDAKMKKIRKDKKVDSDIISIRRSKFGDK